MYAICGTQKSMETREQKIQREATEVSRESRESSPDRDDPLARRAAVMERADYLVKEVKSGTQQIQNIMIHMQQVQSAITALRAQLNTSSSASGAPSLDRDAQVVDKIRAKINMYTNEITSMREDMIHALMHTPNEHQQTLPTRAQAEIVVDSMIDEMNREVLT